MSGFQAEFQVSDFERVLCQEPLPLLIGGQAVNLWAMIYVRDSEVLPRLEPFLSRDCDLYGDRDTLVRLGEATHWNVTFSPKGQPSPVVGFLTGRDDRGRDLTVEVLYTVRGLEAADLSRETIVQLDDRRYRTLSPVTLLKSKLANFVEIPQGGPEQARNDLKHLRILIPCIAGYLADAHNRTVSRGLTERGLVNLLEGTLTVVASEYARRVSQAQQLDFLQCFPVSLKTSPFAKVHSFVSHRIAPLEKAAAKE